MLGLPVLLPRCLFLAMVSLFLIDGIFIFLLNLVLMFTSVRSAYICDFAIKS